MSVDTVTGSGTLGDDTSTINYRYPGSPPFRDSDLDRRLFRGRASEADTVLHSILSSDVFLLYAVSGLGKSSLLNAGVMHELRDRGYWPVSVRLNDTSKPPVQEVREQIEDAAEADPSVELLWDPESELALVGDSGLWDLFASLEVWKGNELQRLVVIFDQFEELFSLGWDDAVRERFIVQFGEVVRGHRLRNGAVPNGIEAPPQPVKFVLVIREDALGELEALATDIPQIMRNRFRLGPLDPEQAEAAIRDPALIDDDRLDSPRFTYTEAATSAILDFLRTRTERGTEVHTSSVDPSQLQIVCQYVERTILPAKAAANPETIAEIDEADLGGRTGLDRILGDFYRRTLQTFPASQQRAVRHLCERGLINPAGRRLSLEEGEINDSFGVTPAMLQQLVDERLIRADPRVGSVYYELAHDTLVPPILAFGQEVRAQQRRRRRRWIAAGAGAVALVAISVFAYQAGTGTSDDPVEARAAPLGLGLSLTGTIDEAGEVVPFAIQPLEGQALMVVVTPVGEGDGSGAGADADAAGGRLNVVVEVTTSQGVTRQQDQLGGGQAEIMVVPPAMPGEPSSELRVTSFDSTTGSFEIALRELAVTELGADTIDSGEIVAPGDLAVFSVDVGGDIPTVIDVIPTPATGQPGNDVNEGDVEGDEEVGGESQGSKASLDAELEVINSAGVGRRTDERETGQPERVTISGSDEQQLVVVRGYVSSTGPFSVEATQVQALTPEEPQTGEVGSGTDVAQYTFELDGNSPYAVEVTSDPDLDAVVEILDPGGTVASIDSDVGGGTEFGVLGGAAGPYLISVTGYDSSTGDFEIVIKSVAALAEGQSEIVELASGTDTAQFAFDVVGGGSYAVTVTPDPEFDAAIEITDPEGVAQNIDSGVDGDTEVGLFGGADGQHLIGVTGFQSGASSFEIMVTPASVQPIQTGDTLTASGPAVFNVDAGAGEFLEFAAGQQSADSFLDIAVYDPDGSQVAGNSSSEPGQPVTLQVGGGTPGTYQVTVNVRGAPSEYTATVTPASVQAIEPGATTTASDFTVFEIDVGDGDLLEFTADPQSDDSFLDIVVYDPDAFPIDGNSAIEPGDPVTVAIGGDVAGTHRVAVGDSGGAPSEYTATLTPAPIVTLLPGDTSAAQGLTVFEVEVGPSEAFDFTADPQSDDSFLDIAVYDPDGLQADGNSAVEPGDPVTVAIGGDAAGTYRVTVRDFGGPGEYTATLEAS